MTWLTLATTISGCATIMSSDRQRVRVRSNAPGAVILYRGDKCIAPCDIYVRRGDKGPVEVTAEGYQNYDRALKRDLNPWLLGNIFFGGLGLITALIDLSNDNAWSTGTDDIYVTLERSSDAPVSVASRPSVEEFEKSIPSKLGKKDVKIDLSDEFPNGWPNKWYYETTEFRYWTIVGEKKGNPTLAMQDSLDKAKKTIEMEFPTEHFRKTMPFETTHVEVKKNSALYRGWRIIRVRNADVGILKK